MKHLSIIADTDSCETFCTSICKSCPLARLKMRSDGTYISCADAVNFKYPGDNTYRKAATALILENLILGEEI